MADRLRFLHVKLWLGGIAVLTVGAAQAGDLEPTVAKYAMLLADEFPAAAFSPDSEAAIAAKLNFWPSYGKLYELVREWWRAHRPALTPIAAATPSEQQQLRDLELRRDWDDPAGITRRVRETDGATPALRQALLSTLAAAVLKYAPQHIGLLPVEAQAAAAVPIAVDAPLEQNARPKPNYFSREQLLAAYEAQGQGGTIRAQMLREQIAGRAKPHMAHADDE